MKFYNPYYFYLLPLLVVLYFIGITGIKDYIKRKHLFINTIASKKLDIKDNTKKKYTSIILWLIIIFFLIIALARPQGKVTSSNIEESSNDIVIAFDISDSMKTTDANISGSYSDNAEIGDLNNLSRFEASKKIIKGFVKTLSNERISLVIFSDIAIPLFPLSNDYQDFNSYLNNLDFSYSSGGGTDIGNAIEISEKRFYEKNKSSAKIIILISDGEEQNKNAVEIAKKAKENNVIIYTIGVGSKKGSKIFLGRDPYGEPFYKTYLGQDVISQLNDKLLIDIAKITGGKYFEIKNEDISEQLFDSIEKIKSNNVRTKSNIQYEEFFQIFILLAIILIMFEIFMPFL
ncbi:MAG: VWA domain-containing protein, partial [Candidatus Sericytochromatia bacterium]|nr:VWA domain-containing protein [Candidatus Sericytochromatia bacterium]